MFKRLFDRVDDRFSISYDRRKYENILDDPNNKIGVFIRNFIIFLVVISVFILVAESLWEFSARGKIVLFIIDFFISTVFLYEYLYRISRSKNKLKFTKNILNIIDLLSFLPFFLGLAFSPVLSAEVLKVFRLARVFRILKLTKHIPVVAGFLRALRDYKDEYKGIGILFLIVLTIVSTLVYNVESKVNPEMFSSIPAAFWWAVVTMATVGYGDMYPITPLGKLIGSSIIILGPVLLAVISAVTILVFMDVVERGRKKKEKKEKKICPRCGKKNKRKANFCIKCGEKLSN